MDTIIQVESWDGQFWTIAGQGKGDRGVWLGEDVSGFWYAPTSTMWNSTAFQDGADFGGTRVDKRTLTFDVEILKTPGSTWEKNWSDFIRAFRTDRETKIWYETETSRRFLIVRLSKNADMRPKIDPQRSGHSTVTIEVVAGDPYWYEDVEVSEFIAETDTTVSGMENGTVALYNETPLFMWPVWVFQGTAGIVWRIPDWSFGQEAMHDRPDGADATRRIIMAPTIENEHVVVDVDPMAKNGQFNSSLDTEYQLRMGGVRFMYPVPDYTGTKANPILLPVSVSGAPIGAGIQLRMRRAWPTPMGMW
jgi:hypothetical protein